ncbi:hypothetical protein L2E05_25695, partial [Salmonella enterica subsp. enterica serovar Weltevreden]|uniref:hypothetical protein n=1 Tax=Salmonella enterica TaxID=28901 RepID=UPI001F1FE106
MGIENSKDTASGNPRKNQTKQKTHHNKKTATHIPKKQNQPPKHKHKNQKKKTKTPPTKTQK